MASGNSFDGRQVEIVRAIPLEIVSRTAPGRGQKVNELYDAGTFYKLHILHTGYVDTVPKRRNWERMVKVLRRFVGDPEADLELLFGSD